MKRCLLALLALSCFDASAAVIRCDNCSEPTYQAQAQSRGAGPAGINTHYVYDLPQGRVRKYEITRSCEEGRVCHNETTSLPVEPDVELAVLELASYWHSTGGAMKSWFTFTADGTAQHLSAFDVAGPGAPRSTLYTWFNTYHVASVQNALPIAGSLIHQVGVTIASIWNDSMGKTMVTIVFSDGSKVTLEYESINNTVAVVEGSATDKHGNIIPVTREQVNGLRFDYSVDGANGSARQRMSNYLYTMFGVPVTNGTTRWSCVAVGDSGWRCGNY